MKNHRRELLVGLLAFNYFLLCCIFVWGAGFPIQPAAAQINSGNIINLLPAGTAISSSSTGTPVTGLQNFPNAFLLVSVTGVPAGGAPTLDVYIQSSPDGGT